MRAFFPGKSLCQRKKTLSLPGKAHLKERTPLSSPKCPLSIAQPAHFAVEDAFLRPKEAFFEKRRHFSRDDSIGRKLIAKQMLAQAAE
jgi:hypothetical protein